MATPDPIIHQDLDIPSYPITHKVHGDARCDDRQWPEFQAKGWERKAVKPKGRKPKGAEGGDADAGDPAGDAGDQEGADGSSDPK